MTVEITEGYEQTTVEIRRVDGADRPVEIRRVDAADRPVVIVESPFSGKSPLGTPRSDEEVAAIMEANRRYAIEACIDCLRRGEVPYASHLFFPQFLDELKPEERELGLTAGYSMWGVATKIVFYEDLGFSLGMERAWRRAVSKSFIRERRRIR